MCSWCSSARPCSSAASNKLSGSHPDDEVDGPGRLAFICENGHCANIVRRKQGEEDRRSKEHNKIAAAIHPAAVHAPTVPAVSVTTTDSKCTEGYDDAGSDDHDDSTATPTDRHIIIAATIIISIAGVIRILTRIVVAMMFFERTTLCRLRLARGTKASRLFTNVSTAATGSQQGAVSAVPDPN